MAEAMRIEATGQWGGCADVRRSPRQGTALAVAVKAHDMVEVHRALAHPSEERTQKRVQAIRIATTGQWGPCKGRLQVKVKRQAVQWIDGSDKTDSNGVGDEDLDVKPGEDGSVGKRGAPQLNVQELELEQPPDPDKESQEASPDLERETREAPPDPEERTQETLPDPKKKTREAPLDPGQETRGVPSDRKEET